MSKVDIRAQKGWSFRDIPCGSTLSTPQTVSLRRGPLMVPSTRNTTCLPARAEILT